MIILISNVWEEGRRMSPTKKMRENVRMSLISLNYLLSLLHNWRLTSIFHEFFSQHNILLLLFWSWLVMVILRIDCVLCCSWCSPKVPLLISFPPFASFFLFCPQLFQSDFLSLSLLSPSTQSFWTYPPLLFFILSCVSCMSLFLLFLFLSVQLNKLSAASAGFLSFLLDAPCPSCVSISFSSLSVHSTRNPFEITSKPKNIRMKSDPTPWYMIWWSQSCWNHFWTHFDRVDHEGNDRS